ncbi:hypothetical protein [Streptomyces viridochromogenes]|nr:hypothetical protein [Streptomyces viridochromogenes]
MQLWNDHVNACGLQAFHYQGKVLGAMVETVDQYCAGHRNRLPWLPAGT